MARFIRRVNEERNPRRISNQPTPIRAVNSRIQKTLYKYKNSVPEPPKIVLVAESECETYLKNIFTNHNLNLNGLNFASEELITFYEKFIKTSVIKSLSINERTLTQNDIYWKEERRLRITASQCYSLYTYTKNKNPDWIKKISTYINPKQFKSSATDYGKNNEQKALDAYQTQTGFIVSKMGLVVNPSASWLACSPDGIDIPRNVLIEVKCPVLGASTNLDELLPKLKKTFLSFENNEWHLKHNHNYYGQVQLSMFILNIEQSDFLVYSLLEDKCAIIPVKKDELFLQKLIPALKYVYETHSLAVLEKILSARM